MIVKVSPDAGGTIRNAPPPEADPYKLNPRRRTRAAPVLARRARCVAVHSGGRAQARVVAVPSSTALHDAMENRRCPLLSTALSRTSS